MYLRTLVVVCLLGMMAAVCGAARAAEESPRETRFFEEQVRPLLADKCHRCHGRDKQEGGLRLDKKSTAEAGGESGPALVPGKPNDSLIIDAINYRSLEMPPDGKLRDDQIAVLTRWIEMGASWPQHDVAPSTTANSITAADKQFWAFLPVRDAVAPTLDDGGWSRNAIDRFIYRKLAAEGLAPAAEASRRTLIRRATYDLTGLPPTSEEISAFLSDDSPQAYEHLIDRLLDSPRYGERWARHWLDLVRYAESHGHGKRPVSSRCLSLSRLRCSSFQSRSSLRPICDRAASRRRSRTRRSRCADRDGFIAALDLRKQSAQSAG